MYVIAMHSLGGLELERRVEEEGRPIDVRELRVEGAIELLFALCRADRTDTKLLVASVG